MLFHVPDGLVLFFVCLIIFCSWSKAACVSAQTAPVQPHDGTSVRGTPQLSSEPRRHQTHRTFDHCCTVHRIIFMTRPFGLPLRVSPCTHAPPCHRHRPWPEAVQVGLQKQKLVVIHPPKKSKSISYIMKINQSWLSRNPSLLSQIILVIEITARKYLQGKKSPASGSLDEHLPS